MAAVGFVGCEMRAWGSYRTSPKTRGATFIARRPVTCRILSWAPPLSVVHRQWPALMFAAAAMLAAGVAWSAFRVFKRSVPRLVPVPFEVFMRDASMDTGAARC